MTRLIGRRCKRSNAFSRPVLIGRGLGEQISARARYGTLKEGSPVRRPKHRARFPVTIAVGPHPFPSRTRKLRPPAPMVLGGQPPGRVGRRRDSCCQTRAMAVARVFCAGGANLGEGYAEAHEPGEPSFGRLATGPRRSAQSAWWSGSPRCTAASIGRAGRPRQAHSCPERYPGE